MKITKLLIIAILSFVLWSCGGAEQAAEDASYAPKQYTEYEEESYNEDVTTAKSQIAQNTDFKQAEPGNGEEQLNDSKKDIAPEVVERKLIKNGRVGFQTDDLGKT